MNNVDKFRSILIALGVPEKQQKELCCHVLLVMGKIYPDSGLAFANGSGLCA